MNDKKFRPVFWDSDEDCLYILDQRKLPHKEVWRKLTTLAQVEKAINTLAVRGAPLLGIVAAYGVYLGVRKCRGGQKKFFKKLDEVIKRLGNTRPTAVNLFATLRRIQEAKWLSQSFSVDKIKQEIFNLGERILAEEEEQSYSIARNGADILDTSIRVLTHCNTGVLAAGGIGTALGIIYEAHRRGYVEDVLVDETRPLLQGARLTAWELQRWNIPYKIVIDSAAPSLIANGVVDVVIVGADRIVRNGDVANKIGTYSLALAAHKHRIPFIVAAPTSSFDLSLIDGEKIEIELRPKDEVLSFAGKSIAPPQARAFTPAFDITPAELISAIVTERGVIEKPDIHKISAHISRGSLAIDMAEL
ncbi:S-methyl-5-thioribose-1-phosphate isomerase [bacterium]|nr:MAG: S-methyl-5-thioribose-1-phosphate isomerase [bacterium]